MSVGPRHLAIDELAEVLGRYRFIELALFTVSGRAAHKDGDPALCRVLSEASHAHAYRASLIERRLPVSIGLAHASEATRSPGPAHDALIERLASVDLEPLVDELGTLWYPSMLDTYQEHLKICAVAADGPIQRMLGRIVYDLEVSLGQIARFVRDGIDPTGHSEAIVYLGKIGGPFGTGFA